MKMFLIKTILQTIKLIEAENIDAYQSNKINDIFYLKNIILSKNIFLK
jgi:hypothetical protein